MGDQDVDDLVRRRFADRHGASVDPTFPRWLGARGGQGRLSAVLGVRSAASGPLFLECYLDSPVEAAVSGALGRAVVRESIVEIGCHAASPTASLLTLWRETADALGVEYEIAVATLTQPLRRAFRRLGVPIVELAPARPGSAPGGAARWGRYYDQDPLVCAGLIVEGAAALHRSLGARGSAA